MQESSWRERINTLFGTPEPPMADKETMSQYLSYLRSRIEHPCFLILAQEESACFEALLLVDFEEEIDEEEGILAKVLRSSDGKEFRLPLVQLDCCRESSPNSQLLDDFGRWFMHTLLRRMNVEGI